MSDPMATAELLRLGDFSPARCFATKNREKLADVVGGEVARRYDAILDHSGIPRDEVEEVIKRGAELGLNGLIRREVVDVVAEHLPPESRENRVVMAKKIASEAPKIGGVVNEALEGLIKQGKATGEDRELLEGYGAVAALSIAGNYEASGGFRPDAEVAKRTVVGVLGEPRMTDDDWKGALGYAAKLDSLKAITVGTPEQRRTLDKLKKEALETVVFGGATLALDYLTDGEHDILKAVKGFFEKEKNGEESKPTGAAAPGPEGEEGEKKEEKRKEDFSGLTPGELQKRILGEKDEGMLGRLWEEKQRRVGILAEKYKESTGAHMGEVIETRIREELRMVIPAYYQTPLVELRRQAPEGRDFDDPMLDGLYKIVYRDEVDRVLQKIYEGAETSTDPVVNKVDPETRASVAGRVRRSRVEAGVHIDYPINDLGQMPPTFDKWKDQNRGRFEYDDNLQNAVENYYKEKELRGKLTEAAAGVGRTSDENSMANYLENQEDRTTGTTAEDRRKIREGSAGEIREIFTKWIIMADKSGPDRESAVRKWEYIKSVWNNAYEARGESEEKEQIGEAWGLFRAEISMIEIGKAMGEFKGGKGSAEELRKKCAFLGPEGVGLWERVQTEVLPVVDIIEGDAARWYRGLLGERQVKEQEKIEEKIKRLMRIKGMGGKTNEEVERLWRVTKRFMKATGKEADVVANVVLEEKRGDAGLVEGLRGDFLVAMWSMAKDPDLMKDETRKFGGWMQPLCTDLISYSTLMAEKRHPEKSYGFCLEGTERRLGLRVDKVGDIKWIPYTDEKKEGRVSMEATLGTDVAVGLWGLWFDQLEAGAATYEAMKRYALTEDRNFKAMVDVYAALSLGHPSIGVAYRPFLTVLATQDENNRSKEPVWATYSEEGPKGREKVVTGSRRAGKSARQLLAEVLVEETKMWYRERYGVSGWEGAMAKEYSGGTLAVDEKIFEPLRSKLGLKGAKRDVGGFVEVLPEVFKAMGVKTK